MLISRSKIGKWIGLFDIWAKKWALESANTQEHKNHVLGILVTPNSPKIHNPQLAIWSFRNVWHGSSCTASNSCFVFLAQKKDTPKLILKGKMLEAPLPWMILYKEGPNIRAHPADGAHVHYEGTPRAHGKSLEKCRRGENRTPRMPRWSGTGAPAPHWGGYPIGQQGLCREWRSEIFQLMRR